MSLDELRAQVEAKEDAEAAEEPEVQDEPKSRSERLSELEKERDDSLAEDDEGSSADTEGEETAEEESEDFELELDGEPEPGQQKPNAEQALIHKLTKQRKKRQEAESEAEKLRRELDELKAQISGHKQPQRQAQPAQDVQLPPFPDMYDKGIDGDRAKYDQAVKRWWVESREAEKVQSQQSQQSEQYRQQLEEKTTNLAKRAAKFMQENKISETRVISAIERATSEVDAATKVDGALAHLLDSVGDGGERVAYYIGTNDAALSQVKEMLAKDPSGLSSIAHMTRLAEKLKPKHSRKTSKAPAPDEPLRGDGSPASAKRLQEKYDKTTSPQEMMRLRQEAKKMGVKLT